MAGKPKPSRGRPRSSAAASHETILDAVYQLLHKRSIRDLTVEEVAKRAKVGKPTIYKWWPNKAALVLNMFEERMAAKLLVPNAKSGEDAIRTQLIELIRLLNGFFGKVAADIISEGQSDPSVLQEYRDRYVSKRRAFTLEVIRQAYACGEFKRPVDPELLIDMLYGPIYYRLLLRHRPIDEQFGNDLLDHVLAYVKG